MLVLVSVLVIVLASVLVLLLVLVLALVLVLVFVSVLVFVRFLLSPLRGSGGGRLGVGVTESFEVSFRWHVT